MTPSALRLTTALAGAAILAACLAAGLSAASKAPATIVFHARLKGGNNEIFAGAPNGNGLVRLTRSRASDSNPAASSQLGIAVITTGVGATFALIASTHVR